MKTFSLCLLFVLLILNPCFATVQGSGGGGINIEGTSTGDMISYNATSGEWEKLAKGANNSLLGVNNSGVLGFHTSLDVGVVSDTSYSVSWDGNNTQCPSADKLYDKFESYVATTITSGTAPTVDAAGEIAVDTTANQLKFYGSSAITMDARRTENVSIASPVSGNKVKFRKPHGMTLTAVGCVVDAATSAVLDVQECDANGASCVTVLSGTATCTTTYGTGSISDSAIASGGYVFVSVGTVTGTVGYLYVNIDYTVTAE